MKLTLDMIKSVTVGAASVYQNSSGAVMFEKCTPKQIQAWYDFGSETLGARAKTTTGIRLDFHTNSKNLIFKTSSGGKFELLIDGMLRERYTPEEGSTSIEKSIRLSNMREEENDEYRITLVFPSHSVGSLEYVEIDDGAYIKRHEFSTKMLFIGDSITQGHNSYYDTLSFAWRVSNHYNAESIINGIGGAFYEPETFDTPNFDPDTVIIAYGTNDAYRFKEYSEMEKRVIGYLDLVKAAYGNKRVVVISPIWRADNAKNVCDTEFKRKREMVEFEAKKRGFEVVHGLELVPPIDEFFADRYLHPNDLGFGLYAENLIKKLDNK